jgi:hypothetical protein
MKHCERNPKTNETGRSHNNDSYYVVLMLSRLRPSDWSKVLIDKQLETFSRSGKSGDQGNTSIPSPLMACCLWGHHTLVRHCLAVHVVTYRFMVVLCANLESKSPLRSPEVDCWTSLQQKDPCCLFRCLHTESSHLKERFARASDVDNGNSGFHHVLIV